MRHVYRKPKFWRASWGALVIGDPPFEVSKPRKRPNKAHDNAKARRATPTRAEAELARILNHLNHGALRGRYFREWAFAEKWILDFYFDEIRLGIEVDGSIHRQSAQKVRDREKEKACNDWHITLLRVSNDEVLGSSKDLTEKLRAAWREAQRRFVLSPYARNSNETTPCRTSKKTSPSETSMGSLYRFTCDACGLNARVSGGTDCGFETITKTLYCRTCHVLVDIALGASDDPNRALQDQATDNNDGFLHCPMCKGTLLKAWSAGQPCPKCGGKVTKDHLEVLWD